MGGSLCKIPTQQTVLIIADDLLNGSEGRALKVTPSPLEVDEDVIRDSLLHRLEVAVHVLRLAVDELTGMVRAKLLQDALGEGAQYEDRPATQPCQTCQTHVKFFWENLSGFDVMRTLMSLGL